MYPLCASWQKVYDAAADTWTPFIPLPTPVRAMAYTHTPSAVLLLGGQSFDHEETSVLSLRRVTQCSFAGCQSKTVETRHSKRLHRCTGCSVAYYCSRECQKQDWKSGGHKQTCTEYAAAGHMPTKGLAWETVSGLELPFSGTYGGATTVLL
jgi:MYND finger